MVDENLRMFVVRLKKKEISFKTGNTSYHKKMGEGYVPTTKLYCGNDIQNMTHMHWHKRLSVKRPSHDCAHKR